MPRSLSSVTPEHQQGNFLSETERNQLYYLKTQLMITGCTFRPAGTFGPNWLVQLGLPDGSERLMSFTDNPYRAQEFGALAEAFRGEDISPIGPVLLTQTKTANGKTAWGMADVPAEVK